MSKKQTEQQQPVKKQYANLCGDLHTFRDQLERFERENTIHEKYISTQFAVVPNPEQKLLNQSGQPQLIETVINSALIIFTPKTKPDAVHAESIS